MNKIDEIKQLRAQVESMTEQAKAEAVARAHDRNEFAQHQLADGFR